MESSHTHTVAIWTSTFHKQSDFVKVILKANFKPVWRPVLWTFWSENSTLFFSFSFYFLQELSNPLLFAHCCCYSNDLTCLSCKNVKQFNLFEIAVTAVDLTTPAKNRRKMSVIDLNFQVKKFMILACTLVWNLPSKSPSQSLIFCEM